MSHAILIHGPTASGKTKLAVHLAQKLNGEIINTDAMQVYGDLQILTARPSPEELGDVRGHLFGHVDAATRYNTGQWLADAKTAYIDIKNRNKLPIFVGGTGLYHLCLTEGLSDIPPISPEVDTEVKRLQKNDGAEAFHAKLSDVDPQSARSINVNDTQRTTRAYAVWLETGKPISDFLGVRRPPLLAKDKWLGVALTPPRAKLYTIIDRRFEAMLVQGAMDEIRALIARDLPGDLPLMKALGMVWMKAYLNGEITAQTAADNSRRDTRRYAKRQFTWVSRQFPLWPRIPSMDIDTQLKVVSNLWAAVDSEAGAA